MKIKSMGRTWRIILRNFLVYKYDDKWIQLTTSSCLLPNLAIQCYGGVGEGIKNRVTLTMKSPMKKDRPVSDLALFEQSLWISSERIKILCLSAMKHLSQLPKCCPSFKRGHIRMWLDSGSNFRTTDFKISQVVITMNDQIKLTVSQKFF